MMERLELPAAVCKEGTRPSHLAGTSLFHITTMETRGAESSGDPPPPGLMVYVRMQKEAGVQAITVHHLKSHKSAGLKSNIEHSF